MPQDGALLALPSCTHKGELVDWRLAKNSALAPYIMGTELSKQDKGESIGSASEASRATTQLIAAKWQAWLQDAEGLYLQGRFRAYREVRCCVVVLVVFL